MGEEDVRNFMADIGNTSIRLCYGPSESESVFKSFLTPGLAEAYLSEVLADATEPSHFYISSVNSLRAGAFTKFLEGFGRCSYEYVTPAGLSGWVKASGYKIPNLDILASDLFFDIVGAPFNSIVADYGTAGKIMFIDAGGEFRGGMIGPGLKMMNAALAAKTELLDQYPLELPPGFFSLKTKDAINASSVFGEALKLIGVYERTAAKEKSGSDLNMILTGGDGRLVCRALTELGFRRFVFDERHLFKGMAKTLRIFR